MTVRGKMLKFLKRLCGTRAEVANVVVQEASDGDDAIMKNAMLALKTGRPVYGGFEEGVLTSRIQRKTK